MNSRRDDGDLTADRALLGMAKIVVPVEPPERVQARRDRLVPRLSAFTDDVFARTPPRSSRHRIALGAVAAMVLAASLCLFGWRAWRAGSVEAFDAAGRAVVRTSEGAVRIRHAGSPEGAVVAGQAPFSLNLGAQDRIETTEGRAEVNLASRAVVALEPATELQLGAVQRSLGTVTERIELVAGRIGVKVPKLPTGSRLVVGTPHSTVTVHGTAFVVEVRPASGGAESFTTVSVTEGRVSVEREGREVFLGPGTQWSSRGRPESARSPDTAPFAASEDDGSGTANDPETRPGRMNPEDFAPKAGASARRSSTLPEENLLLRSAMTARRDGDPRRALELLGRLLRTYPLSPLGPEAQVERARALLDLEAKSPP